MQILDCIDLISVGICNIFVLISSLVCPVIGNIISNFIANSVTPFIEYMIFSPIYLSEAFTLNACESLIEATILLINNLLGLQLTEEVVSSVSSNLYYDITEMLNLIFGLNAEPVSMGEFLSSKLL